MMPIGLRIFCVSAAILALLLLFAGCMAVWVTASMRTKYGEDLSAYQSMRRYVLDHWLDADIEPRTHPDSSPIVDISDSAVIDVSEPDASESTTQLAKFDKIAGRVLLTRTTGSKAPIILPCELTNGGLPLLMVRIPGSSPTKVVLDTASDYLLIADKDKCKQCSVDIYGGAPSDAKQEANAPKVKVYFGSQVDDVQFQVRDIQLGDFAIVKKVPVGVVKARKTRVEDNTHTFNILGIGAMGMRNASLGTSMIERLLQNYNQPNVFGFYFGADMRDGLFVLGYAAKKTRPILTLPMYPHPTKPYYLLKIASLELVPHPDGNKQTVIVNNVDQKLPEMLVDTGANFMALPKSLEPYFKRKGQVHELYFHFETPEGLKSLRIPHSRLYNRKGLELFYFAQDRAVLGTFGMSLFSYVEFDFVRKPTLRFWV
jgi:hypothetical protein